MLKGSTRNPQAKMCDKEPKQSRGRTVTRHLYPHPFARCREVALVAIAPVV